MLHAIPITLSLLSYRRFEWRWLVGARWKQLELVGSGRIQLEPCLLISHALVTVTSWRELLLASGISDHGRPWKEGLTAFSLRGRGVTCCLLHKAPEVRWWSWSLSRQSQRPKHNLGPGGTPLTSGSLFLPLGAAGHRLAESNEMGWRGTVLERKDRLILSAF